MNLTYVSDRRCKGTLYENHQHPLALLNTPHDFDTSKMQLKEALRLALLLLPLSHLICNSSCDHTESLGSHIGTVDHYTWVTDSSRSDPSMLPNWKYPNDRSNSNPISTIWAQLRGWRDFLRSVVLILTQWQNHNGRSWSELILSMMEISQEVNMKNADIICYITSQSHKHCTHLSSCMPWCGTEMQGLPGECCQSRATTPVKWYV